MATMTTTEIAADLDTTPRTLRKFLRADAKERGIATPGKGARYAIEKKDMRSLRTRFAKWLEATAKPVETDADAPEAPEVPSE